jgi:hypothetical protein
MLLLSALPNPRVLPSLQGRRDELEKKYESVQRWMLGLRSLTGSEYTIKRSLNAMLHYCDWTGKDPDALVRESKTSSKMMSAFAAGMRILR